VPNFPLWPDRASGVAAQVDALFLFGLGITVLFSTLIFVSILYLGIKYRRRSPDEVGIPMSSHSKAATRLEITWSVIPLLILTFMFLWGAKIYFTIARPPRDAVEYTVVGKQWMWKIQHPEGIREINELHVPVGRDVRLTMASEDVIHDFSLPAFRVKMDVVPGRFTTLWFRATKPGTYHIYCAQFCGTKHSGMVGQVTAMTPQDYEAWLAGGRASGTPIQNGERLFTELQCITCHKADGTGRGPSLVGVAGNAVDLADGRSVTADDNYLRESILNSQAKVVKGFQPIMPLFQGQIGEENLLQLIAYVKSLKPVAGEKK